MNISRRFWAFPLHKWNRSFSILSPLIIIALICFLISVASIFNLPCICTWFEQPFFLPLPRRAPMSPLYLKQMRFFSLTMSVIKHLITVQKEPASNRNVDILGYYTQQKQTVVYTVSILRKIECKVALFQNFHFVWSANAAHNAL